MNDIIKRRHTPGGAPQATAFLWPSRTVPMVLLVPLVLLSAVLLFGCGQTFGFFSSDSALVTIDTGLGSSGEARNAGAPENIEYVVLYVGGPDMAPIERTITTAAIQIEVPSGSQRVFILDAYETESYYLEGFIPTYRGYTVSDLSPGENVTVQLTMQYPTPVNYTIFHGDNDPRNPTLVISAMLPVPLYPPINVDELYTFSHWVDYYSFTEIDSITADMLEGSPTSLEIEAVFDGGA